MRKLFCVILAFLVVFPLSRSVATAGSVETGTLSVLAYNVSGIPVVGDFQGDVFTTTADRAKLIGGLLNGCGADFIGVEEDFNSHDQLASAMTAYPYRSFTSGGLAQGQGLNFFSTRRIYNIERVNWEKEYGFLSGSMDAVANKGFLYCLAELEPCVYIDIITVHMDAGYDPLSVLCRSDNFRQLASYINDNLSTERALIVLGDFNFKFKRALNDDINANLLEPTGLRDVWTELYNNGLTDINDPGWNFDAPGDDLDRMLYRSGRTLTLTPLSRTSPELVGIDGERYTDHLPLKCEFSYVVNDNETDVAQLQEPVAPNKLKQSVSEFFYTLLRFVQIIIGLLELPYLLGQGVNEIVNFGKMP